MNQKLITVILSLVFVVSFGLKGAELFGESKEEHVIAVLTKMVHERTAAMEGGDLEAVMAQFADDATFIDSAGYFYSNKREIEQFHKKLGIGDGVRYKYRAGKVTVRLIDDKNALVYYPWEMDWFNVATPRELSKEVGLMTLSAHRRVGGWVWIAITSQHTRTFFDDLSFHRPSSSGEGKKD